VTEKVRVCECFARDGLQHEERIIPTAVKIAVIDAFSAAGFPRVEATSYSHPDRVPAFKDASEVLRGIQRRPGSHYKATCANLRSIQRAQADLEAGFAATELSLLLSATESHTMRNLRATRAQQWERIEEMVKAASGRFRLVGVISAAFGCPFEGWVDPSVVIEDMQRFVALGVDLVALGDTTGLATPQTVKSLFRRASTEAPTVTAIAHFHNTRGSALANCMAALEAGCRDFDSSMGGVGGHPAQIQYGQGMTGNVATEDLVNLLEGMGFDTGLDLERLTAASALCEQTLGRNLHSMVARSGFGLLRKASADSGSPR
jgi:hydroxymethylglutaryl-CoA lyase